MTTPIQSKTPGGGFFPACGDSNDLFCASASLHQKLKGGWRKGDREIKEFVQESIKAEDANGRFLLIAGTGSGTRDRLSVTETLLNGTENTIEPVTEAGLLKVLGFHDRTFELIPSLPGYLAMSHPLPLNGLDVYHIIFCSPKSSVREIFCAVRVAFPSGQSTGQRVPSMRCIIFDNFIINHADREQEPEKPKKGRTEKKERANTSDAYPLYRLLEALGVESTDEHAPWRHPITLIAALNKECAWSSELRQKELNHAILGVELGADTASWTGEPRTFTELTSRNLSSELANLQRQRTNITFVKNALQFQESVWETLPGLISETALGQFPSHNIHIMQDILFEKRKLTGGMNQLAGLTSRFEIQSNLLDSITSHKDSQHSAILSVVALAFAPASVVLSVFSLPFVNYLDGREWTVSLFTNVMIPCSVIPSFVGTIYVARHQILAFCRWLWNAKVHLSHHLNAWAKATTRRNDKDLNRSGEEEQMAMGEGAHVTTSDLRAGLKRGAAGGLAQSESPV